MPPFKLLNLPRELRDRSYDIYLKDCEHMTAFEDKLPQASILRASKQLYREVLWAMRRQNMLTYRVSCDRIIHYGHPFLCDESDHPVVKVASFRHIRVEIEPASFEDPMEMIHIIRTVKDFCEFIRPIARLPRLTIAFLENESFSWSESVERQLVEAPGGSSFKWSITVPRESISDRLKQFAYSDVGHCLDVFATLMNVTKVSIHLPQSLQKNEALIRFKLRRERSMMNIEPISQTWLDSWMAQVEVEMLEIEQNSWRQETAAMVKARVQKHGDLSYEDTWRQYDEWVMRCMYICGVDLFPIVPELRTDYDLWMTERVHQHWGTPFPDGWKEYDTQMASRICKYRSSPYPWVVRIVQNERMVRCTYLVEL